MSNPTGTRNGARNGALNGTPPPRRIHPAWLLGALALTLVAAYFAPDGVTRKRNARAAIARSRNDRVLSVVRK